MSQKVSGKAKFFLSLMGASSLLAPVLLWFVYHNFLFPSPPLPAQAVSEGLSPFSPMAKVSEEPNPAPSTSSGKVAGIYQESESKETFGRPLSESSPSTQSSLEVFEESLPGGSLAQVNSSELHDLWSQEKILVLDIRNLADFESGHLSGAYNIPPEAFDYFSSTVPKEIPTVLYGNRGESLSQQLGQKMVSEGFKRIYVLTEGYQSWEEQGYPTEK
jgi:rhodanese-related sulfurtransferase